MFEQNLLELQTELEQELQVQLRIVEEANKKLEFIKASQYLNNLQNESKYVVLSHLRDYYSDRINDKGEIKTFEGLELTSWSSVSRTEKIVRMRIDSYKSRTDSTKMPEWGREAIKMAKVVDTYLNTENK